MTFTDNDEDNLFKNNYELNLPVKFSENYKNKVEKYIEDTYILINVVEGYTKSITFEI